MESVFLKNSLKLLSVPMLLITILTSLTLSGVAYSEASAVKKNSHQKVLVRKKTKPFLKKPVGSDFTNANTDTFNEDVKQIAKKMSYPINSSGRVGFTIKNKPQVGMSFRF